MEITRRRFIGLAATAAGLVALGTIPGCASSSSGSSGSTSPKATGTLALDSSKWNYDSTNDVYYQIGIVYCEKPAATAYESMGIYVPGAYMDGKKNSDGTYTCTVKSNGKAGSYTASTAPVVIPVNTAGYAAQAAPTQYNYNGLSDYLSAGLIYLYPGLRGRDNGYDSSGKLTYSGGAPWGVTDLKAAIRYYRYNAASLPGDSSRIFTFGHSGGGAQSALAGSTGDSALYTPYLESIGAPMNDSAGNALSDATYGAMCWCPITSLDYADEAYEWNMGQFASSGTRADGTWTKALSDDLAARFADYINTLGLKDSSGDTLTLEASSDGIYTAGSYYRYLVGVVETSLNNFLSDTAFPYTPSSQTMSDGGFGGGASGGTVGGRGGASSAGSAPSGSGGGAPSGAVGGRSTTAGSSSSATYQSAQEYIDSLTSDVAWITYDSGSNTASISGMAAFVTHCKNASKDVCAFDSLTRSQAENNLFGDDTSDYLHFDPTIASLLAGNASRYATYSGYDSGYAQAYADDLANVDALGGSVAVRVAMYNPMYYLSPAYEGCGASTVAKHWRIRTGIDQGDTALPVETNLALALSQDSRVSDVDFATVWGLGHTTAERTGSAASNFISWVKECG